MTQTTIDHPSWRNDEPATFDLSGIPRTAYIPLLSVLYAIGVSLFVAVEPTKPWILLIVVALVGLGTDGIMRSHPRASLRRWSDTAPFLFVPVLFALASGLFLDEVVSGFRTVPAVIVAACLVSGGLYGEYVTAISHGPSYALGRLLLNILTYLSAFAFFAVVYEFDISLLPASFAVGLFSMLLAVEVFRESEVDAFRALLFSAAIGLVLAEARWALYFIPLDGFLAATLLLLVFYQTTGLIQHHLTRDLSRTIAVEFSAVTAVGLAIVVFGRILGIG
jgi:Protein of unknown function (DUF5656)